MSLPPVLAAVAWALIAPASTRAAEQDDTPATAIEAGAEDPFRTDSDQYPDLLDGTLSALGDLEEDNSPHTGHVEPPALAPWFALKQRITDRTGISFSGSYGVLWQNYSSYTPLGEANSVGHKLTLNFSAALLNRGKPNALTFDMAIEDRRPYTEFAPLQAGIRAGSGLPTAATWGDFNLGVTQAYVRQSLAGGKFQWTIGKLFAPNYVDAYPFFDDNRQFLNLAFSTSPTIAVPLRGFGLVAAVYPGEANIYITGGMFTANSSDTGWTVNDFFDRNEHFYFIEFGQTTFARRGIPINARGPMDRNNIHVTFWRRDALKLRPGEAPGLTRPSPKAIGATFSVNRMIGENAMWFLRGGMSDGGFASGNVSGGFGWRPKTKTSDLFGLAAGWSKPQQPDLPIPLPQLRSQTTAEVFYRYHLTANLALTPDYQLIFNPSLNPTKDTLSVFSVRARIAF